MHGTFQVSNTYGIQSHPLKDLIEVHIDLLLHLHPQQLNHGAKGDFDHHHHNLFYMNDTTLTSSPSCNWQKNLMTREIENKTSQELRMLSNVTLNCQVAKIVMNSCSQLSEL